MAIHSWVEHEPNARFGHGGRKTSSCLPRAPCIAACLLLTAGHLNGQPTENRWSIAADRSLSIGVVDGEDPYLFESIASARFLQDGRLAVVDRGRFELRIFSSEGKLLTRSGRQGGGPGEFSDIHGLWLTADGRIAIWDSGHRRVTLLDSQGGLESTRLVESPPFRGHLEVFVGAFKNDDVVLGALSLGERGPALPPLVADRMTLGRFTLDGEYVRSTGVADAMWRFTGYVVPFSSAPMSVLLKDSIFIADGYEGEIRVLDSHGRVSRQIRIPEVDAASPELAWSSLEAQLRERRMNLYLAYLDRDRIPKDGPIPKIGGLLADDQGRMWVKRYDASRDALWLRENALWPASGGEWLVIDRDGSPVASVRMPDDVRPLEIRGDRLLGVSTDSLGVQRVVVHMILSHQGS